MFCFFVFFCRMHLSKALQPGLHIPLGLRKLFVCLKCKGKTSESLSISNDNPVYEKEKKMLIHAVSLFSAERGWKQAGNRFWVPDRTVRSLSFLLAKPILQEGEGVAESLKVIGIRKPFFSRPRLLLSARSVARVLLWDSRTVSLACLSWLGSVPLDESVFNWCVL